MKKQYVYFYFMKQKPEKIQQIVPKHVSYWKRAQADGYKGGPFADRSGGLIMFKADTLDEAKKIVNKDPFIKEDLLEHQWLKEWITE